MSEFLSLQETAQYVDGRPRMPETVLLDILGANNNEFKALIQAPLVEDVPLSIYHDVLPRFPNGDHETAVQTVSYGQLYAALVEMPDEFVRVEPSRPRAVVTQTAAGHTLSAPVAGHMASLSFDGNVSLRSLIGEIRHPKEDKHGVLGRSTIEARRILLTDLWEHTREGWIHTGDLIDMAVEKGVTDSQADTHIRSMERNGFIERRHPNRRLRAERYHKGKMARLKPENGHMPATAIVERYLSIILLASVADSDFRAEGLEKLAKISSDSRAIPYLIKRAFANGGHVGKSTKRKRD